MNDAILLLGAGGFVGSRLMSALISRGMPVIAASRSTFKTSELVERHVGVLREPQDFAKWLPRCHAVVHVAAASTPGSTAAQPIREIKDNLWPTLGLLEALQDFPKIHLLYLSSGGTLYGKSTGHPADEQTSTMPRSYHGAGKLAAEAFIAAWCHQYQARATILRPSNLYGPGQAGRVGFGIVPTAFEKLTRGEALHVWGNGSARRDYLYIDDFIELCQAVLSNPAPTRGARIVNACSGDSISLNDLLSAIQRVTGRELELTYEKSRAIDVPDVRMLAERAHELFGWSANTTLDEGLRNTWAWFNTIPR